MSRYRIARTSVSVVVGLIVAVSYAEGDAATQPLGSAADATSSSELSSKEQPIPGRAAVYALPNGCGPAGKKFQCNPVTNAGCDRAKDEACDDDDHGGFGCYAGPNTAKDGAKCDDDEGCGGGFGCDTDDGDDEGVCKRFCCTNAECGSKKCVVIQRSFGSLGFCE